MTKPEDEAENDECLWCGQNWQNCECFDDWDDGEDYEDDYWGN